MITIIQGINKMKILLLTLSIIYFNCQEINESKINYPGGDKILYSEFTGITSQRLILFSLKEQKEYEIPLGFMKDFPHWAKFSPDGKKLLIKCPYYIDLIYLLDLTTAKWEKKIFPELIIPKENKYYSGDYLNDTTIIIKGTYNLLFLSLSSNKLIDRIAINDTFFISGYGINSSNNQITINYGLPWGLYGDVSLSTLNTLLYDFVNKKYIKYFPNTGMFYQWINGTDYLYCIDSIAIKYNMLTGEREPLAFNDNLGDSILYPQSKFINENRFLMMKLENHDFYQNDFYIYNFENDSIVQITNTKTYKSFFDLYINE